MRKVIYSLTVMAVALFTVPAVFAQTAAATGGGTNWGPIAAGFGMALAAVGAAAKGKIAQAFFVLHCRGITALHQEEP